MTTPLDDNPALRRKVYVTFWLLSITLGGFEVFFASYGWPTPPWLHAATGVYMFVSSAIGYTAWSNTAKGLSDVAQQAQEAMSSIQDAKNKIAPIASGAIDGGKSEESKAKGD